MHNNFKEYNIQFILKLIWFVFDQSAGAVEYTDFTSAEG